MAGAVGAIVNMICNKTCTNACSWITAGANLILGCMGGSAAGEKDNVLQIVIGLMGFNIGIIYGLCDNL